MWSTRRNMGKYTADPNLVCGGTDSNVTTIDKVQQELPPGTVGSLFSTPTLYTSSTGAQDVYFTQSNGPTRAFTLSGGKLSTAATSSSSGNGGDPARLDATAHGGHRHRLGLGLRRGTARP